MNNRNTFPGSFSLHWISLLIQQAHSAATGFCCQKRNLYSFYQSSIVSPSTLLMVYSRWVRAGLPLWIFSLCRSNILFSSRPFGIQSLSVRSVKKAITSLSLTSSLFPVSSSCMNFPSNVMNSSSVSCCLSRIRDEAWREPINKIQSLWWKCALKSWSSAKMSMMFLKSAGISCIFPRKWFFSAWALLLSLSVFRTITVFILVSKALGQCMNELKSGLWKFVNKTLVQFKSS